MMTSCRFHLFAAGAFVFAVIAACSSNDSSGGACAAGDQQICSCAGGASGTKTCASGAFGACDCSRTGDASAPIDGATVSDATLPIGDSGFHDGGGPSTSDAAFGQYLGPCLMLSDCPTGDVCYDFSSKGMYCTKTCGDAGDCPAPSPKCTPKGYCAIPD